MNINDIRSSRYLKKEDVGEGVFVTIKSLSKENVAMEGAEESYKVVVHFEELEKPMVVNSTNGQIIAQITGQDEDIEHTWVGAKIVLYNEPNISFGGKLTGGIRVRAPKVPTKSDLPF